MAKRVTRRDKTGRDWHDYAVLLIEFFGVVGIVATLALTYCNNKSTSDDMSNALGTMSNIAGTLRDQQTAIIKQSAATENLALETNTVANAASQQADNTRVATGIAKQQADTSNRQLSQNIDLFAAQQRPIIQFNPDDAHSQNPQRQGNVVAWSYGFTNYGQSPAYNVKFYETLTAYGQSHTNRRRSRGILIPHAPRNAAASLTLDPAKISPGQRSAPRLRVKFDYSDALGRKYHDDFCLEIQPSGPPGVC
jgi:hypothetical protein